MVNKSSVSIYLGVGSNLNHPRDQVASAYHALKQEADLHSVVMSPLYLSRAIGPGDQPDYINCVIRAECDLTPDSLLHKLQQIESRHQRQRLVRWGPRTLDLDILLYGNQVVESARLRIPHPRLSERNFVIFPLYDLAPDLVLPNGVAIASLLTAVGNSGLQQL